MRSSKKQKELKSLRKQFYENFKHSDYYEYSFDECLEVAKFIAGVFCRCQLLATVLRPCYACSLVEALNEED